VMNKGLIEQQGEPATLYDNPATTFVSNFLGQSNLVHAQVIGRSGEEYVVDAQGSKLGVPAARAHSVEGAVWAGIRPEKIFLADSGADPESGTNVLRDGRVSDVSYIGVSTQYLVRMPWGQELTVFEQNTGARRPFAAGENVDLHWQSAHTFLLDAAQDAAAGAEVEQ